METTTLGSDKDKTIGGDQGSAYGGQNIAGQNNPQGQAKPNQVGQTQSDQNTNRSQDIAATAAQIGQAVQQGVSNIVDAAGLTASVDKAKETATNVAHSVADAASYVGQRADSAATSVGSALESTGHYLKEDGLRNITADITDLVKRNPIPALLLGIGFGFLLAQASARRVA